MDFHVKYRGAIRELREIVDGLAVLDDGTCANPREIEHPAYHPTLGLTAARTAAADADGVMVALRPPDALLRDLAATGVVTEDFSTLHITLAYFDPPPSTEALHRVMRRWTGIVDPISIRLGGWGKFTPPGSDEVLYASIDSPGIETWRSALLAICRQEGLQWSERHGFQPHLTCAYAPEVKVPDTPPPSNPVTIDTAISTEGPQWTSWLVGAHDLAFAASRTASADALDFDFGGGGDGRYQYDGWVAAYLDDQKVGYLDWAVGSLVGENTLWVKMVQVEPEHRSKGYAKAMLDYVVREQFTRWGEPEPIIWGDSFSDEGRTWWAKVVEPAYQTTTKSRVGALNEESRGAPTPEDLREIRDEVARGWSDLTYCSQTAERVLEDFGLPVAMGGYYGPGRPIEGDGSHPGVPHDWNVDSDGTIFDAATAQFGDGDVRIIPPGDSRQQWYVEEQRRTSVLHDEPEPALPRTEADEPDEEVTEEHDDMSLISQAAKAHLQTKQAKMHAAKQALRDFTPMEQRELIDEGAGRTRARNLSALNLDGTHYDPAALDEDPEDFGFGW